MQVETLAGYLSDRRGEEDFNGNSNFPTDESVLDIGNFVEATVIPLFDKMDSLDSFNHTETDILLPSVGTLSRASPLRDSDLTLPLGLPEEFWSADKVDTTVDIDDGSAVRNDSRRLDLNSSGT